MEYKKEDAYRNLDRVNGWCSNCDSKASILLTLIGVTISVVFTTDIVLDTLKEIIGSFFIYWKDLYLKIDWLSLIIVIISCTNIYFMVKSIYWLLCSLTANIDSTTMNEEGLEKKSCLFFGTISSEKSYKDFKDRTANISSDELMNDINSQIYINSKIITKKFVCYNKSIKNLKKGLILLLFFLLLIIIKSAL